MKSLISTSWKLIWAQRLACIMLFLAPLWMGVYQWYPHVTSKVSLITVFTVVISILYFWYAFEKKEESSVVRTTWLHVGLLLFILVLSISGLAGVNPLGSFFGSFDRGMSITFFGTLGLFSIVYSELLRRNSALLRSSLLAIFVSGIIVALSSYIGKTGLYHIVVWSLTESGGSLFLGNTSFAGPFLVTSIFSGFYLFITAQKKNNKIWHALGVLVILLCPTIAHTILVTCQGALGWITQHPLDLIGDANGAVIGMCIGAVASLFVYLSYSSQKITKKVAGVLVLLLVAGCVYTGANLMNPNSSLHHSFVKSKTENRFLFWDIARAAGKERPLLGYGYNNFQYIYQHNFDNRVFSPNYAPEKWVDRPHNFVFEYFALSGILGLVSYLALFTLALFGAYRTTFSLPEKEERWLRSLFVGGLVAYFIQNLFVFDTQIPLLMFFVMMGIAYTGHKEMSISSWLNKKVYSRSWFVVAFSVVSLAALIPLVLLPTIESKRWYSVTRKVKISEYSKTRKNIESISLVGTSDDTGLASSMFVDAVIRSTPQITPKSQASVISALTTALDSVTGQLEKHPNDYRLTYMAGRIAHTMFFVSTLFEKGDQSNHPMAKKSHEYLLASTLLNPRNPDPYLEDAQLLTQMNDRRGALQQFRTALDLASYYDITYSVARIVLRAFPDQQLAQLVAKREVEYNKYLAGLKPDTLCPIIEPSNK